MSPSTANFSLLVVTYQCADSLDPFFSTWAQTLAACPPLAATRPPIVVVDSGSPDDTPAIAGARAAAVPNAGPATLLTLENIGYGSAANAGMAEITTEWILLCNPDLTFPPEFAQHFLAPVLLQPRTLDLPDDVSAVAPRLVNPDGSPQPSVGRWPTISGLIRDQFRPRPQRKYVPHPPTATGPIAWASGACLLLRREALATVGGFDPYFFLYVEEVDLQYRLTQVEYLIYYRPEAVVTHHAPNAARPPRPEAQSWAARGLLRFFAVHSPYLRLPPYRLLALLSGRLGPRDAFARRSTILRRPTGP